MYVLYELVARPVKVLEVDACVARSRVAMVVKGGAEVHAPLPQQAHRHEPKAGPKIEAVLGAIEKLLLQQLRNVEILGQEYVVVKQSEVLCTAVLDKISEQVVAGDAVGVAAVPFGDKLLAGQPDISDVVPFANFQDFVRNLFPCGVVEDRITEGIFEKAV